MRIFNVFSILILVLVLICGCFGGKSNSTDGISEEDISGTYVFSHFRTFHIEATVENEVEVIEDVYLGDGTGTYQVEADDGSFRDEESLIYDVLRNGEVNRQATLNDNSSFEMQGVFSRNLDMVIWIDKDHQDEASTANIGIGFGFKKSNVMPELEGTYQAVMVNNAKGAAAFKLSRLEYEFYDNGTGYTIGGNGSQVNDMSYSVEEDSSLTSLFEGQTRTVEMQGFASRDGDYFFLADLDQTDSVIAIQYGVKESSGTTADSIKGEYHIAVLHNDNASKPWTVKGIINFDGSGDFSITEETVSGTGQDGLFSGTYSVTDNGSISMIYDGGTEEAEGIISPDREIIMLTDHTTSGTNADVLSLMLFMKF